MGKLKPCKILWNFIISTLRVSSRKKASASSRTKTLSSLRSRPLLLPENWFKIEPSVEMIIWAEPSGLSTAVLHKVYSGACLMMRVTTLESYITSSRVCPIIMTWVFFIAGLILRMEPMMKAPDFPAPFFAWAISESCYLESSSTLMMNGMAIAWILEGLSQFKPSLMPALRPAGILYSSSSQERF